MCCKRAPHIYSPKASTLFESQIQVQCISCCPPFTMRRFALQESVHEPQPLHKLESLMHDPCYHSC
jgi:hypothetical protein